MCPLCYHRGGSLLHCLSTLTISAYGGISLLHWPWSHLHRTLSGILPCEARTFLTHSLSSEWPRSSVSLTYIHFNTKIKNYTYRITIRWYPGFISFLYRETTASRKFTDNGIVRKLIRSKSEKIIQKFQ